MTPSKKKPGQRQIRKKKQTIKAQKLKTFLAVFLGNTAAMSKWENLPPQIRQQREKEGMLALHAWVLENQKSILDMGSPLGKTKKINRSGISNSSNEMGAFTLVQAPSHSAAANLFKNHPHFSIFPGDRVEVMECHPIPKIPASI